MVTDIYSNHVTRSGRAVRLVPHWYKRRRCFKALRRGGEGSNRNENAITAETLSHVAILAEQGLAIRMGLRDDPNFSPIRVAPEHIVIRRRVQDVC